MSYDHWKLMSPDDERTSRDFYECDVCCTMTPRHHIQLVETSTGLETYACPTCRGYDPADYDED